MKLNKPLLLKETRVWRIYQGGALLDKFKGRSELIDNFFPEDWIGSTTQAVNRDREHIIEGLSKLEIIENGTTTEVILSDLLKEKERCLEILGEAHYNKFGSSSELLVKLLDSKIRLPLQTHPDKKFSKRFLNSDYGKTECWIVMDGREINGEKPYVYFGFKNGTKKEDFEKYYLKQNIPAMLNCMNKYEAKPGDVYIIPGNLIHAIGAGVFLVELQEPSDHVFQIDKKGECWNLSDFQVHMNLGDKLMLNSFDYNITEEDINNKYSSCFNMNTKEEGIQQVLPNFIKEFFMCNYVTAYNTERVLDSFIIGIITSGSGTIKSKMGELKVKKGDTCLIPHATKKVIYISDSPDTPLQLLEAIPPSYLK